MACRYSDSERSLTIGVRDLLESGGTSGDLRSAVAYSPAARMEAGRLAHKDWQDAASEQEPNYRPEVSIKVSFIVHDWECTVLGRVDGLIASESGESWAVEEIKSTLLPTSRIDGTSSRDWPHWCEQLEVYIALLGEMGREDVTGELVVISLCDGGRVSLPVMPDLVRVRREIVGRLTVLVQRREEWLRWRELRRVTEVPFPHETPRSHQLEMSQEVADAVARGQQLLLSSPTGTGKTAAVLHGALEESARLGTKLFFATARGTQREIVERTVLRSAERSGRAGLPLRVTSITAREKLCLNDVVDCRPEMCRFARGHFDKVESNGLIARALAEGVFGIAKSIEYGEEFHVCPHALSMEVAQSADMVIGDYNYAFDPFMGFSTLFKDGWDDWVVLVDEAHNLVGRGRGYGSPRISQNDAEPAAEWLLESYGSDASAHVSIVNDIDGLISSYEDDVEPDSETEWEVELGRAKFRALVERIERAAVDYMLLRASRPREGDLYNDLTRKFRRFVDVLESSGDETLHVYTESLDGERGLRLVCLDPSVFMRRQFSLFSSAVLMSATLRPMTYHRDLLGLSQDKVIEAEHPSPFPSANRGVFLATRVSTAYRDRAAHLKATVAMISEIVSATPGNVAVYYSSYAVMRSMASEVRVAGRSSRTQKPSMSDDERAAFLSNLTAAGPESGGYTTLHAVLGGIFSEGVDLPSGALKSVVVVGPALPPVGLERRRISEWCEDRHGDGFAYAFLIPGMAKVVQAAGRLIRSSEDRGAVVLIGRRFGWRDYRALLPDEWSVLRPDDPASAVEEFFEVTLNSGDDDACVERPQERC